RQPHSYTVGWPKWLPANPGNGIIGFMCTKITVISAEITSFGSFNQFEQAHGNDIYQSFHALEKTCAYLDLLFPGDLLAQFHRGSHYFTAADIARVCVLRRYVLPAQCHRIPLFYLPAPLENPASARAGYHGVVHRRLRADLYPVTDG